MSAKRAFALTFLTLAGLGLQGCIAAAIPIVAGGAVARSEAEKNRPDRTVTPDPQPVEEAVEIAAEAVPQAPTPAAPPPAPEPTSFTAVQSPQFTEFVRYSARMAFLHREGSEPFPSAVLREPSALDGERIECEPGNERPPAILIDMDPGDEPFSEGSPLPASSSAALSLKVLRSEGVTIAWLSENSAATADIVRIALTESGLDAEAEDTLLMMRYPGDRKQTRREEFAAEHCLIAMAGDRRRDFDELYDYLTNRNAALELEALISNGWFLIGEKIEPFNTATTQATAPATTTDTPDTDEESTDQ